MQQQEDCQPIAQCRDRKAGKHHRECQVIFKVCIPWCTGRLKMVFERIYTGDQFQFNDDMILLVLSSPYFTGSFGS